MIKAIPKLDNPLIKDMGLKTNKDLKEVCKEFEALFIKELLNQEKDKEDYSFFGNESGSDMIRYLFNERISILISRSRGMGIGELLYKSLNR